MNRNEAIEVIKKNCPNVGISGSEFETALRELVPELEESEDERIRKHLLIHFRNKTKETWCNIPVKDILAWLEKLKNCYIVPKSHLDPVGEKGEEGKPPEWSEEDEDRLESIMMWLDEEKPEYVEKDKEWLKNRVKSLRPQPHWKPSKEQMEALKHCVDGWPDRADGILDSLYNDLKTL